MFAVENETWCLATAAGISMTCVHEFWSDDDFLAGILCDEDVAGCQPVCFEFSGWWSWCF